MRCVPRVIFAFHSAAGEKTAATCPEAFGKLGYTWGQGEVVSLRSLPDYKIIMIQRNILKMCVLPGRMELMQQLLQLWPMPLLWLPTQKSK